MKQFIVCAILFSALLFSSNAFADKCDSLETNATWNDGLKAIIEYYNQENYEESLKIAKNLEETICPRSPSLSYIIAKTYKRMNDRKREQFYLELATRNANEFSLSFDALEKMWTDRIYAVRPQYAPEAVLEAYQREVNRHKIMMWTSISVGSVGVVSAITGGILLGLSKNEPADIDYTRKPQAQPTSIYTAGWALVGSGIGLAVAGIILSGISAHNYVLSSNELDALKNETSFSFSISPVSTSLAFTF